MRHLRSSPQSCRVGLCVRKGTREGTLFISVLEQNKQPRSRKEHIIVTRSTAGIAIPDRKLSTEAADALREYGTALLWNHSQRVFLFGSLLGRQENLKYDAELLYIGAVFHDLGLTEHYSSLDKRVEVDSANAARGFLEQHGIPKEATQLLWDPITLHQTIGVAQYKQPVAALLYHGVGFDVMGDRFEELSEQTRQQVVSAFPRDGFKNQLLHAFLDGFRHKPETTFGNISSDVCERYLPGYTRPNFCDLLRQSPWNHEM